MPFDNQRSCDNISISFRARFVLKCPTTDHFDKEREREREREQTGPETNLIITKQSQISIEIYNSRVVKKQ